VAGKLGQGISKNTRQIKTSLPLDWFCFGSNAAMHKNQNGCKTTLFSAVTNSEAPVYVNVDIKVRFTA